MIVEQGLTDQHTDDPSQVGPILDQVDEEIKKVTAYVDYVAYVAYVAAPTYQTIA